MTQKTEWYRYTINHYNNMLNDPEGFGIYEKFFMLGLDKTRKYIGDEFALKLLDLYRLVNKRRNKLLISLFFVIVLQQPLLLRRAV